VGEELEKQGYVGTWQVGRGSNRPPAVLRLDFNPTGDEMAPVEAALVGKGITFDSGGYSIKTSEGMLAMKMDMGGAAYVAGALWLAITRGLNKRVRMYLCCAENLISGHAYKLGDVIKYPNGTTVEIVNTDAEGRIVMADGLLKATEANIPLVIDAATLTGAAHVAVGNEYNALFSLDDALAEKALKAAADESEPLWRLPLAPFHRHKCPSPYADTANSVPTKGGGAGGASNAAGFLSRFVNEKGSGWLHFDLSGAFYGKDTASWSAGGTAMGIRTIARLLTDQV
jgi:PepB aminopeptidase